MSTQNEKLIRLLEVHKELEARKVFYEEYDKLVAELRAEGFTHEILEGFDMTLVDNFADKNTVFRPAGVKRFEITIKAQKPKKGA